MQRIAVYSMRMVHCSDARTVILPGGLLLRTMQDIIDVGCVFACQIVERTLKEFTMERRCDPKDRSFTVELQRYKEDALYQKNLGKEPALISRTLFV